MWYILYTLTIYYNIPHNILNNIPNIIGTLHIVVGIRAAFAETWPDALFTQCWPHIARKWGEGEWVSKKWAHFDEILEQLRRVHHASTVAMMDALLGIYGRMWDSWGHEMDTFWSSYCDDPWCCWNLCDCGLIMLATPSNQTQESWHREILSPRSLACSSVARRRCWPSRCLNSSASTGTTSRRNYASMYRR